MSETKSVNVLAVGIGGQGIIRLSDILADLAFKAGYDIKKSEIHGLSQRGGSVTSHIRWGKKVYTPVIMDGTADFLLALEELEALRYAHKVKPGGIILVNDFSALPVTVVMGTAEYPEDLYDQLATYGKVERIAASKTANELGNIRASNTVMLGALSRHLDISDEIWESVLHDSFPEKFRALNTEAFERGRGGSEVKS
jgi:indolepyruvate ferredoxin oxidoreductase beta subunit